MMDPRSIWIVTLNGRPSHCAWAAVRTYVEGEALAPVMKKSPSWCAALDPDQLPVDGWDATPSKWRRVGPLVRPDWLEMDPDTPAALDGRDVVVAGVRVSLDTEGRSRGQGKEPDEPNSDVEDEDLLLEHVERKGQRVGLRDKQGKRWEVHPGGKPEKHGRPDFLLYRENGRKKKEADPVE